MVLTRCFYDCDSVADALISSILQKHPLRKQHSLFWAHELWVSEEYELLQKSLTKAFLQMIPFQGGLDIWKQLSTSEQSILNFMGYLLAQPTPTTSSINKSQIPTIEVLQTLVKKSSKSRIHLLLEGIPFKTALSLLPTEIVKSVDDSFLNEIKRQGKGLAWILDVSPQSCLAPLILQWPSRKIGFLSARTFRCSKRKATFEPSPYGILTGCAAWQRILNESGCIMSESQKERRLVFETKEAEKAFYCQYFPEDIPDEWSTVEKQKGHLTTSC